MSNEQTYRITLKISTTEWGMFESIRMLKGKSTINEELVSKINNALQVTFVPTPPVRTTIAIGDDAEQKVMHHLRLLSESNIDFEVHDTSSMLNHGDMAVLHHGRRICVEVKNYSKPVPLAEVTKYHRSLAHAEYDCGIMIQMGTCGFIRECGIRTPIDFRIDNGKPSIYLTGVDLTILYQVINMLIVFLQTSEPADDDELERKRKNLLSIYEQICCLRTTVEQQKKLITKMESAIDAITKLSLAED